MFKGHSKCLLTKLVLIASLSWTPGCTEPPKAEAPPAGVHKTIKWNINKETAVKVRGGYHVYLGTTPGFTEGQEIQKIAVAGTDITGSVASATITGLGPGQYYVKIKAYSDLIDPITSQASVSAFSDEVSFAITE